jgi:hypothetical protein
VVRGLVEQEQVGLREQQAAERDPALLTAGEDGDVGVAGRAAQGAMAISIWRSRSSAPTAWILASSSACSAPIFS